MKKKPLVLINYKGCTGAKARRLSESLSGAGRTFVDQYEPVLVVQPEDASYAAATTGLPVFIHDIFLPVTLHELLGTDYLQRHSIDGVLINHPDKKVPEEVLQKDFSCAKAAGLTTVIIATDIEEALSLNHLYSPHYMAIESKELIGKAKSIRNECPGMVKAAIAAIPNNLLFGAGVKDWQDIRFVTGNGGNGVLVSSIIVGSEDPMKALTELLEPVVPA